MNSRHLALGLALSASMAVAGGGAFTAKPTAIKDGDKVKIEFAVDRETDVAVFVEDANGRVIRHLVAGVLGTNAPPPMNPGLAQSIEWDGKGDWGKPAASGPHKARVALGLSAQYDKEVIADPLSIGDVQAIATGPDGTLYAVVRAGTSGPNWPSQRLVALNRDGTFQRTLIPPPAATTKEQLQAMGGVPVEVGGRTVPMVMEVNARRHTAFTVRRHMGQISLTPGGQLLFLHPGDIIGLLDTTLPKSPPPLLGPKLMPAMPSSTFQTLDPYDVQPAYLASSGDGKHAYFSGLAKQKSPYGEKSKVIPPYPAVFRVRLPERSPAEPFFGDLEKTGNDGKLLGGMPRGMAADGKGNLLVCDTANNRVVVISEADGRFVGSFASEGADFVAVNRGSGEVYLLKPGKDVAAKLVKLAGWKDPKPLASIALTSPVWPPRKLSWQLAVDSGTKPPVLWVAVEGSPLLRIEDQGDKFSAATKIAGRDIGDAGFVGLTVDHFREDPEVYSRISGSGYRIGFARYNEKTDKTDTVTMHTASTAAGSIVEPGPDGNLYVQAWPTELLKCDRDGKPIKWDVPFVVPEGGRKGSPPMPNAIYSLVTMVYMTHTLGIRGDGQLFVFDGHPTEGKNGTHALFEYSPSGVGGPGPGKTPIVWGGSDSIIGPRFDQEGNIYVAEQIRPADQLIPPEFAGICGPVTMKSGWPNADPRAAVAQMYGSIVKFTPKGGSFNFQVYRPRADEPKPDPAAKVIEAASWICQVHNHFSPNKVIGAEWMHMGISQVSLHNCNCENTRFDVDPFGRVWYPDLGRYRVGVLDTAGNLITTFGTYGNADNRGPDIAFAWLIGVGATDKYAYMGDSLNRRLLRAKLLYTAEAVCDVK